MSQPPDKPPRPPTTRLSTPTEVMQPTRRPFPSRPELRQKPVEEVRPPEGSHVDHSEKRLAPADQEHLVDQSKLMLLIARAVGVKNDAVPHNLVVRTLPPPAGPDATPTPAPKAPIPLATKVTYAAIALALLEAITNVSKLIHHLMQ